MSPADWGFGPFRIISCDGYSVVAEANTPEEALALVMDDTLGTPGYTRLIKNSDGRTVGDCVDGLYSAEQMRGWVPPMDAATATGMYDRY